MPADPGGAGPGSLAVLEIDGADAANFLHAQLCGDVLGLASGHCRFTAWCNPKGRAIATMLVARGGDGFRAFLCRDIVARVRQRLAMFVLRARVQIRDRSRDLAIAGGTSTPVPGADSAWEYAEQDGLAAAALPGTDGPRWLLCGAPARLAGFAGSDADSWVREDVAAGLAWIGASFSEAFLPQELNLELLDGLSYTKGCYPGQEVIARVHSRGRQKRELRAFALDSVPPAAGTAIVAAGGAPAGIVIAAAPDGAASGRGLAVMERAALSGGEALHVESPTGPVLRLDAGQH